MRRRRTPVGTRSWLHALWFQLCCVGCVLAAPTPEHMLMGLRDALVRNDLPAVVEHLIPPAERARQREQMARQSEREHSPESLAWKRRQFDEGFGMLISPDAVARMMAEITPRLEEWRLPMLAGQAMFFVQANTELQNSEHLSAEQKQQLLALLHAGQLYLARTDVLSSDRAQATVRELVMAARATGIVSFEQMEKLQYDDAMQRFGVFLGAAKRAAAHYDLDVNAVLRSARFRTLRMTADSADLEVEFSLLDVPLRAPLTLHAHADHGWFLKPDPERTPPPDELDLELEAEVAAELALQAELEASGMSPSISDPARREE